MITNAAWWKGALLRALYTAIAVGIPYLAGGATVRSIDWVMVGSVAGLGVVLSFVTSLAGLPEAIGVDLPWWLSALERVAKTFGQAMVSGLAGATLLSGVPWVHVLQASALAAFISMLRLILATLPQDPTAVPLADLGVTADGAAVVTTVAAPEPDPAPEPASNGDPLPDANTVTS
ncbi:MAG TPA: holin [Humibacter sp.]|nr:holin [Humibacter sp.]